jgi:DNA polymerase V
VAWQRASPRGSGQSGIADPLASKRADPQFIRERFNIVLERLVLELRGIPCIALEEVTPDRKGLIRVKLRQT